MAPEQIVGESVTVRADVYGAALLLWEMLAGRHAFDRDSLPELEILQAMAEPRIPPIERLRPDLPHTLCRALGRALRTDADERIGARDMLDELRVLVQSADARAGLADDLGRARRAVSTVPDEPIGRAWTAYAAAVDPDATTDHGIAIPVDVPEPSSTVPARIRARLDSDTPTATVAPIPVPLPTAAPSPFAQSVPRPRPRRTRRLLAYLLAAAVALAPLAGGARSVGRPSSAQPRRAARSFLAPAVETRADDARTESAPALPTDVGILETPDGMANHRVFVDGVVRGTGGQTFRLSCGPHAVRLGSAGRLQWVDVPCGAALHLER
jgi:serine/threonine-protein kinase